MIFQFTRWHLSLGDIERSNKGHWVFNGLYIINYELDGRNTFNTTHACRNIYAIGITTPWSNNLILFDLIECFTTTFLRTHSWLPRSNNAWCMIYSPVKSLGDIERSNKGHWVFIGLYILNYELDDCIISNTKLYHRNLLLWISTKFAIWMAKKHFSPPVQSNVKPN